MNIQSPSHDSRGFTLIELLIVVVIIGILAAIAVPKFSQSRQQAFRAAMMTDLKNVAHFQELFYNDSFSYSDDLDLLGAEMTNGVEIDVTEAHNSGWAATASHSATPEDATCGVFHGTAVPGEGSPATVEGVIACSF